MAGFSDLSTNKTETIGCGLIISSVVIALSYITYRLALSGCYWGIFIMWCACVFAIGFSMYAIGKTEKTVKYGLRMFIGSIIVPDIAVLVCLFIAKNYETFVTVLVVSLFLSGLAVLDKNKRKQIEINKGTFKRIN